MSWYVTPTTARPSSRVLAERLLSSGNSSPARLAPRRPEVHDDRLAAKVGEPHVAAAVERGEREVGAGDPTSARRRR